MTYESVPTIDGVIGIANYGPTATLFTLGRNHTVQQCDINPGNVPMQVGTVQHVPANTPPSPPNSIEEQKNPYSALPTAVSTVASALPLYLESESENEASALSPLEKIAREMDQLDSERRDMVGPLSPTSSRASSVSSRSSGGGRRAPSYRYDRPPSSRASELSQNEGTEFSFGQSLRPDRQSMSIRSTSSYAPSNYRASNLRKEVIRSPEEQRQVQLMDLFVFTKARLFEVPFRTPQYGQGARTAEILRREMLSVVFGWHDDIESLVRDELSRHEPGSASAVLLAKWLGESGADAMASMIGSETMTSADWMLLALSSIGQDSQKKVGEAFVQRLLEKGDVHPAVAILLGLGEHNDAVEVYVSQRYFMEAVLLTCLIFPSDWQRQSFLVRKWGEVAVASGQPELAVRCFSCTSIETSEPWFSPAAQDAVFNAQKEQVLGPALWSPPLSPPSATGSSRMTAKNAALKLITTFGDKGAPVQNRNEDATPMQRLGVGVTPIAQSALSPGGVQPWLQTKERKEREPSTARTATPGAYGRKRFPSRSDVDRSRAPSETPMTAARSFALFKPADPSTSESDAQENVSRKSSMSSKSSVASSSSRVRRKLHDPDYLPSPAQGVFARLREDSRTRNGSRERKPDGLTLQVLDTAFIHSAVTPGLSTATTESGMSSVSGYTSRSDKFGPAIDPYISSLEQAKLQRKKERAESRTRAGSRPRTRNESRGRKDVRYIKPAKRSPSSPVPMSPDEVFAATQAAASKQEERQRQTSPERNNRPSSRAASRAASRAPSPDRLRPGGRGRSQQRKAGSTARSPSSPLPMSPEMGMQREDDETQSDGQRVRIRQRSASQQPRDQSVRKERSPSRNRQMRSSSRRPSNAEGLGMNMPNPSVESVTEESEVSPGRPRRFGLTRKELAAKELEDRRLSLARRPSAPSIPLPGQQSAGRPPMQPRYHTELGESPQSFLPPLSGGSTISRSQTVDPENMVRFMKTTGTSTPSAPIGLPATPRAMKHPRYMSTDPNEREGIPAVPPIPTDLPQLTATVFGQSGVQGASPEDDLGPLLPSTVFGGRPSAPARSASAPPEKAFGGLPSHPAYKPALPSSGRRGSASRHARKSSASEQHLLPSMPQHSPPPVTASIDETLHDNQVVIIEDPELAPMILPELQHLAGPPPPPPPPTMFSNPTNSSGVINIAIEEEPEPLVIDVDTLPTLPATSFPTLPTAPPVERATTTSPSMHRRGRNSVTSVSEGLGSRFPGVKDRMRSTSRSRAKSPPMPDWRPYETVLPSVPNPSSSQPQHNSHGHGHGHARRESLSRAKSPYEASLSSASAASLSSHSASNSLSDNQMQMQIPPPPPPLGAHGVAMEKVIPPERSQSAMGAAMGGYRHPKEVRANMPPELLGRGVYQPGSMI